MPNSSSVDGSGTSAFLHLKCKCGSVVKGVSNAGVTSRRDTPRKRQGLQSHAKARSIAGICVLRMQDADMQRI